MWYLYPTLFLTFLEPGNTQSEWAYSAQSWVYELVNVQPVWAQGLTGAGVQIVVNDGGVNPEIKDIEVSGEQERQLDLSDNLLFATIATIPKHKEMSFTPHPPSIPTRTLHDYMPGSFRLSGFMPTVRTGPEAFQHDHEAARHGVCDDCSRGR